MEKTAVITGASSGIGRAFAEKLAGEAERYGIENIYLIGRNKERLEQTAEKIGIKSRVLSLDLSRTEDIEKYAEILKSENPNVVYLVNAAGYGKFGNYGEINLSASVGMIELNCRGLVMMTEKTLPYMREGARIAQISSVASFQPLPKANVYAASKAFVTSYSRALNLELKDRKISVTTVCPGWTGTAFFDRACGTDNRDAVKNYAFMVSPEKVAEVAFRHIDKRREVSVITLPFKIQRIGTKLLPHKLAMSAFLFMQREK